MSRDLQIWTNAPAGPFSIQVVNPPAKPDFIIAANVRMNKRDHTFWTQANLVPGPASLNLIAGNSYSVKLVIVFFGKTKTTISVRADWPGIEQARVYQHDFTGSNGDVLIAYLGIQAVI